MPLILETLKTKTRNGRISAQGPVSNLVPEVSLAWGLWHPNGRSSCLREYGGILLTSGAWGTMAIEYDASYEINGAKFPFYIREFKPFQIIRLSLDDYTESEFGICGGYKSRANFQRDRCSSLDVRQVQPSSDC